MSVLEFANPKSSTIG